MNLKTEAGFNKYGALPAIDRVKQSLIEGKEVVVLEDSLEFGHNPLGCARDGLRSSKTTEYRHYICKKLYQNYVLLESVSGNYRRGITYFDLAKWGRNSYLCTT